MNVDAEALLPRCDDHMIGFAERKRSPRMIASGPCSAVLHAPKTVTRQPPRRPIHPILGADFGALQLHGSPQRIGPRRTYSTTRLTHGGRAGCPDPPNTRRRESCARHSSPPLRCARVPNERRRHLRWRDRRGRRRGRSPT